MRGEREFHASYHASHPSSSSSGHAPAAAVSSSSSAAPVAAASAVAGRSGGGLSIQELKQMTAMRISQQQPQPASTQLLQQTRQQYAPTSMSVHSQQQHLPHVALNNSASAHGSRDTHHQQQQGQVPTVAYSTYNYAKMNDGGGHGDRPMSIPPSSSSSSSSALDSSSASLYDATATYASAPRSGMSPSETSAALQQRGGYGGSGSNSGSSAPGGGAVSQQQPIVIVTSAPNHAAYDGSVLFSDSQNTHHSGGAGYSSYSSSVGGGRSVSSSGSTSSSGGKPAHHYQQQNQQQPQQHSGGGRGRRREGTVPQGLSVQELKELTRIRLEREALEASRARTSKAIQPPSNSPAVNNPATFSSHSHMAAEFSTTSDLSDRDSDTSHTSGKSHPGRGSNNNSQWPLLASDGGPLMTQSSHARPVESLHSGLMGGSFGGAPIPNSRTGTGGYPYADLDFLTPQSVSNNPEPVLNTSFSAGLSYLSDDSLTSSSATNARNANPRVGSLYSSSMQDGGSVSSHGYRYGGRDNAYSSSYRAGKLSDSSSTASISSNSTEGARSTSSFMPDSYRSNAGAILASNSTHDLFASDFGGMLALDQGSNAIITSQGPLPAGDWALPVSSVAEGVSFAAADQGFNVDTLNQGSVRANNSQVGGSALTRTSTSGQGNGGRGLLGDTIRHMLSIDTSTPLPSAFAGSSQANIPPPPSMAFVGPAYLVSPKSLRNRPQIAVDCPDNIRRRSVSDSLPFEVAEAVLGTPPGSPGSTPTLGAHRKFLTANAPRASNGSPKVATQPQSAFANSTSDLSFEPSVDEITATAAGSILSSVPGPLLRTGSGSRTLADALLSGAASVSLKDSP